MMIELSLIDNDTPCRAWLDSFKSYASVADDSQDSLLHSLLLRACLQVQKMADKSILACRFRLSVDDAEGSVKLYQTVSEVVSVKDGEGNGVSWVRNGRMILVGHTTVEVEYTTKPNPMDAEALMPVVFQYATALYDGEDSSTLSNILKQCL